MEIDATKPLQPDQPDGRYARRLAQRPARKHEVERRRPTRPAVWRATPTSGARAPRRFPTSPSTRPPIRSTRRSRRTGRAGTSTCARPITPATGPQRRTTAHIGPYWLDTVAPEAVDVTYADPPPGNTIDNTLYVEYTGTDNPGGSGLAGFSYEWSHDPPTAPSPVTNTVATAVTSSPLADGLYYFHIRAVDLAGNSDKITHFGPWRVDTTQPAPPYIALDEPSRRHVEPGLLRVRGAVGAAHRTPAASRATRWSGTTQQHRARHDLDTTATSVTSPSLAEGNGGSTYARWTAAAPGASPGTPVLSGWIAPAQLRDDRAPLLRGQRTRSP